MSSSPSVQPPKKKIRKKWIIYPQFQWKMILTHLMIQAAVFAIIGFQLHHSLGDLRASVGKTFPADSFYFQLLNVQTAAIFRSLWVGLSIGLVLTIVMSVLLSHKLAGPIVRLRGYFKSLREKGHVSEELKFRKGDFFSDLPEEINGALGIISNSKKNKKEHEDAA